MSRPTVRMGAPATANPPLYVSQADAFRHYNALFDLKPDERDLYRRLLLEGPVRGRYIGMDTPEDAVETDQDALIRRYLKYARLTASNAIRGALAEANLSPDDVGGLVVNSCTGYLCPGLTSYLAEDVGLPEHIRFLDLMGMGCGGALPNLDSAMGMLVRQPDRPVLSVAVEICTATLFMGDDPGLVVSNAIFGDGASAVVLTTGRTDEQVDRRRMRLLDLESGLFPEHREHLHYRTEDHRLRNVLGIRVPIVGAMAVHTVAARLLTRHGLSQDDIQHWIVHPGGTSVLDSVARKFGLPASALQRSYEVLEEYGNMSSPSVMFVLRRTLDLDEPRPGERGLLLSFGAGFSAFAALVEF